jgi:tetratricopeptide (TPR) repeat protein
MKEYAPGIGSTELSLVDVAAPPDDAPDAVAEVDTPAVKEPAWALIATAPIATVPIATAPTATAPTATAPAATAPAESAFAPVAAGADRFLAKAIEEHAAGRIDRMLWAHAVAQAGGDDEQVKNIYLQIRATALRVTKGDNTAVRQAKDEEIVINAPNSGFDLPPPAAVIARENGSGNAAVRGGAKPKRRRMMVLAGVSGSLVALAGLVVAFSGSDPVRQDIAANRAPGVTAATRSKAVAKPVPATAGTDSAADVIAAAQDLVAKVRTFKKEGNWNVVVLYAVEWTRKQPGNPDAWKELSQGYMKLRQYEEAQDAATKAVKLAPEDFMQWQNLGQINVAMQRPAEALEAFHHAAVLNDHDVVSLVQAGVLNAELGHLPEARTAFAQALALSPQDVQALCGASSVAQREGRVKDAQAMAQQVASLAERCSAPIGASVRVAAGALAAPQARSTTR